MRNLLQEILTLIKFNLMDQIVLMAHQELGLELLDRVRDDLEELAGVEQRPEMMGRLMIMVMAPHKKGTKPGKQISGE